MPSLLAVSTRCVVNVALKRNVSKLSNDSIVFSGIQPTGIPHIGNYLGAIKQWKDLQEQPGTKYFSIVDLHALTSPNISKSVLQTNILQCAASLLACGLDPAECVIFQQSSVAEHTCLAWLFSTLITTTRTSNMTHWKEKSQNKNAGNVGLFTYPLLQAADILLYKSTHVPVGEDQTQHVELTRELTRRFHSRYGKIFPIVEQITSTGNRIKSLRNPDIKMSKSDSTPAGRIELMDDPDTVAKKIRKSVTDNICEVTYDPVNRPGVSNLINIHSAISDISIAEIIENCGNKNMNVFQYKLLLIESLLDFLKPIQAEYKRLQEDKQYVIKQLNIGSLKAQQVASTNWKSIEALVGLQL